jgi:hypothetical protein
MALANYGGAFDLGKVDFRRQIALRDRRSYRVVIPPIGVKAGMRRGLQERDRIAISRLSLWTVPVPSPVMRAT